MNSNVIFAVVFFLFVGTCEAQFGSLLTSCTKCQWNSDGMRARNLLSSSNSSATSNSNCDFNDAAKKALAPTTLCILGQACAEFKATVNGTNYRFMGCIRSDACPDDDDFKSYTAIDGTKGYLRCPANVNAVSAMLLIISALWSIYYKY